MSGQLIHSWQLGYQLYLLAAAYPQKYFLTLICVPGCLSLGGMKELEGLSTLA
jgi:hypothetical protein